MDSKNQRAPGYHWAIVDDGRDWTVVEVTESGWVYVTGDVESERVPDVHQWGPYLGMEPGGTESKSKDQDLAGWRKSISDEVERLSVGEDIVGPRERAKALRWVLEHVLPRPPATERQSAGEDNDDGPAEVWVMVRDGEPLGLQVRARDESSDWYPTRYIRAGLCATGVQQELLDISKRVMAAVDRAEAKECKSVVEDAERLARQLPPIPGTPALAQDQINRARNMILRLLRHLECRSMFRDQVEAWLRKANDLIADDQRTGAGRAGAHARWATEFEEWLSQTTDCGSVSEGGE